MGSNTEEFLQHHLLIVNSAVCKVTQTKDIKSSIKNAKLAWFGLERRGFFKIKV
jgi:hypothetical protein